MKALHKILSLALLSTLTAISTTAFSDSTSDPYRRLHQGSKWSSADWKSFYSLDQGSLIIPYAWAVALKESNGQLFRLSSELSGTVFKQG